VVRKNQVMDGEFPLANTLVHLGKGVLNIAEPEPHYKRKSERCGARKQRAPAALRPSPPGSLQGHSAEADPHLADLSRYLVGVTPIETPRSRT
jgi:hypothetical protein